jgi:hypothetical protein
LFCLLNADSSSSVYSIPSNDTRSPGGGGADENLVNPIKIDGLRGRDLNPEPKNLRRSLVELIECAHSGGEI